MIKKALTLVGRYQPIHLPWSAIGNIEVMPVRANKLRGYEHDRQAKLIVKELGDADFLIPWHTAFEALLPKDIDHRVTSDPSRTFAYFLRNGRQAR